LEQGTCTGVTSKSERRRRVFLRIKHLTPRRGGKCRRITTIDHRGSACQWTWRDATVESAYPPWKRQRGIRAKVGERTARSRMLARAQPTKNDGSPRRTNPESLSSRKPAPPVSQIGQVHLAQCVTTTRFRERSRPRWDTTRCDPKVEPHGKRPPGAQRWHRKQTIPRSANIMRACEMRGSRWRKDVSSSAFLM
jgi:hypothetical protein